MSDNPQKVDFTVYREIQSPFLTEDPADDSQVTATDASLQELTLTNSENSLTHHEVRPFKQSSILAFFTPNGPSPASSSTAVRSGFNVNKPPLAVDHSLIDRSLEHQPPPVEHSLTDRSPTSLVPMRVVKENNTTVEPALIDRSTRRHPPPVEYSITDRSPTSLVPMRVVKENNTTVEPALIDRSTRRHPPPVEYSITDRSPTSLVSTRAFKPNHTAVEPAITDRSIRQPPPVEHSITNRSPTSLVSTRAFKPNHTAVEPAITDRSIRQPPPVEHSITDRSPTSLVSTRVFKPNHTAVEPAITDRSIRQPPPVEHSITDRSPTSLVPMRVAKENNTTVEPAITDCSTHQPPPVEYSITDRSPTSQVSMRVSKASHMSVEPTISSSTDIVFDIVHDPEYFKRSDNHNKLDLNNLKHLHDLDTASLCNNSRSLNDDLSPANSSSVPQDTVPQGRKRFRPSTDIIDVDDLNPSPNPVSPPEPSQVTDEALSFWRSDKTTFNPSSDWATDGWAVPPPSPVSPLANDDHPQPTRTNTNVITPPTLFDKHYATRETVEETEFPSLPTQGINFTALRVPIYLLEKMQSQSQSDPISEKTQQSTQLAVDDIIKSFTESLRELNLKPNEPTTVPPNDNSNAIKNPRTLDKQPNLKIHFNNNADVHDSAFTRIVSLQTELPNNPAPGPSQPTGNTRATPMDTPGNHQALQLSEALKSIAAENIAITTQPNVPLDQPSSAQYNSNLNVSNQFTKQAYYANVLPEALDTWRSYRAALNREHNCSLRASFTRYLAKSMRIPDWAVTSLPPAGLITTPSAALQVINLRRQHAIQIMNLCATLLDNKAAAHHISVETNFEGLKKQYAVHAPSTGGSDTFSFPTAIQLARKLVERDTATLNAKFHTESDKLKLAPEASLWKGIPTHLVAPNVAGMTDMNTYAPSTLRSGPSTQSSDPNSQSALFSEVLNYIQREKGGTTPVSPLSQAAPTGGQLMTAPWGPPPTPPPQRRQKPSRQNQPRRGPYRPPQTDTPRNPQEGYQRRQDRNRNQQGRQANFRQDEQYPLSPRERNLLQRILEKSRA